MPKNDLKNLILDAISIPRGAGGGKEDKPPCWQDAGLFNLTLPDTGRCRRILGPLENPKSLQNRTFEARFEILAPKMASERVSGDTSKNP